MSETQAAPNGRKQARAPIKEGEVMLRSGEYRGRNGEILKRSPFKGGNKFDIPDDIKEPGWSYQWIRHSIYQNTEFSELPAMRRSGWREVSPDGLKGYFKDQTPEGQNFISDEGLILVERPEGMTKEAQQEAVMRANRQYQGQLHKIYDESAQLPSGFKPWRAPSDDIGLGAPERAPSEWKPVHRPARQINPDDE
jgi:hypothetical protein